MKSFVLLCILGTARAAGGSIETRDSQSGERKSEFFNNGIANPFPVSPVKNEASSHLESLLEINDNQPQQRYSRLAFINVSWFQGNGEIESEIDLQERSKYGMGKILDVDGRLIHVTDAYYEDDHSACNESLRDSYGNPLTDVVKPWIALIKRGGCDFEKKIMNVFKLKASGAIIYNNMTGSELNYMKITKKELLEGNITSVFTPQYKGRALASLIDKHEHVFVSIRIGKADERNINLSHRSSVLFVTISFIIVMVISMLWLVVYYYQRFRYLQTKENERKMDSNKAKEALKKIPTKQIKTLSKELESDCCAVCIEAYKVNDVLRSLPCKHDFHRSCIDPWLLEHHTCPLCKAKVLKQFGYVNTGSQESIIQLELDDDDDVEVMTGQRRYSVSPMPQIRASDSHETSETTSPVVDIEHDPPAMTSVFHSNDHSSNSCVPCDGKHGKSLSNSSSLPSKIVTSVCSECSQETTNNFPAETHQTLDASKMKRYAKIRPTILSPNCDTNRDSEVNGKV